MPKIRLSHAEILTIAMSAVAIIISIAAIQQGNNTALQSRRANVWLVGAQVVSHAQTTYLRAFCSLKAFDMRSDDFMKKYQKSLDGLKEVRETLNVVQIADNSDLDELEQRLDTLAAADLAFQATIIEVKAMRSPDELERFNAMCTDGG